MKRNSVRSSPSGARGPLGWAVDRFDGIPVKKMLALVSVLGTVLALTQVPLPGPTPLCRKTPAGGVKGLSYVYKPSRFLVKETCVWVKGTVVAWRHEHDGDYHVSMVIDAKYGQWTNALNDQRQHGYTVVEFVPRLPHPKFVVGQRLKMLGTKVLDLQHGDHKTNGHMEMHPVFEYNDLSPPLRQVPNPKGLAPPTEEAG